MTAGTTILNEPSRLALRIMSDEDVARLHRAALVLLGDEGAAMAEEAAAQAPASFVLAGRDPAYDLLWDGSHSWLAAGGPAELVRPTNGGALRAANGADLDEACRLADALHDVGLVVCPLVRTGDLTTLGELRCCLGATRKHVQVATLRSVAEAECAVRMARVIASAPASMATRPPISLCAGADGLAAGLVFARAGLPVGLVLDVRGGRCRPRTSPPRSCVTMQGCSPGVVPSRPKPPARRSSTSSPARARGGRHPALRTFCSRSAPCSSRATWGCRSAWGLWPRAPANRTGSRVPTTPSGALGALAAHGAVVFGAGTLSRGRVFSLQQLVMDAEIFSWSARIAAGIRVDQDTLALDAIKQVGIGGNYLGHGHTRQHMRRVWRPRLLDRSMWDAWVTSGREGAFEKASSHVEQLLGAHEGVPLDDVTSGALEDIVVEAGL